MPLDWKITRDLRTQVTMLQVFHPNSNNVAATGTGKDIWEARENALAQTDDESDAYKYILAHLFPDVQ